MKIYRNTVMVITAFLLVGCTNETAANELEQCKSVITTMCECLDEPLVEPRYNTTFNEYGDFELKLIAATEYNVSEYDELNSEFTFHGDTLINIWSTPSYHLFSILDLEDNIMFAEETVFQAVIHTFEPDQSDEFTLSLETLDLPKGEYYAVSYVEFSLEENPDEYIVLSAKVPFKVV